MELEIHARNLELNEKSRDYITRKVNKLSRHLPGITTATVELARENTRVQDQRVVVQVTLDIGGTFLRAEERGANAVAAVDSVTNVMDRRVERYKGKVYKSQQAKKAGKDTSIRSLGLTPEIDGDGPTVDEFYEANGTPVRVKRFPVKPMTTDEAAFQMELLGHDFFPFLNQETDQYSLLYKRRVGDYGLIQPEPL